MISNRVAFRLVMSVRVVSGPFGPPSATKVVGLCVPIALCNDRSESVLHVSDLGDNSSGVGGLFPSKLTSELRDAGIRVNPYEFNACDFSEIL
jgi:hypothetical protein